MRILFQVVLGLVLLVGVLASKLILIRVRLCLLPRINCHKQLFFVFLPAGVPGG